MELSTAIRKVKEKGIRYAVKYCIKKGPWANKGGADSDAFIDEKAFNILLLTNRDSDNVGDQVIEACDIGLISAVMKNLNIKPGRYQINSRAASIVSQKYMSTRDDNLLKSAKKAIKQSDVVIFGGAPLFNYLYQNFYERTAVTLEIIEEYQKPAIFSAIGIERYEEEHPKCQRVKNALNMNCVKQITTRDNLPALQKFKESDHIVIDKVSDPAVFSSEIFKNQIVSRKPGQKKKVGLFILRANGFVDNKINFTREDSAVFWKNLIHELENRGYDYELLTSGHFGDEAFIDYLIRKYNINSDKCVFNMNSPEKLIEKISSYDAVISCRLHPSIISFALDVPSLGIVWNTKVKGFYDSIGYEDRVIETTDMTPENVADRIEQIIAEGITKDEAFLTSVYNALFHGIKNIVCPDADIKPYSYEELKANIPPYKGTSSKEQEEKLQRKFRRTYNTYNDRFDKNMQYQKTIESLKAENKQLKEQLKELNEHQS